MLKIHKKLRIPLLLIPISLGGIFLFQYFTFIPEYSSATEISTEDPITPTTPVTEWNKLRYMQQMTLEACEDAPTPAAKTSDGKINTDVPAKQLIDSRDGKTYWIAKLADGNCWMTQNLDLDLYVDGANRTLTPEDSNVSENWPSADKPGTGPSTKSGYSDSNGYYKAQYYDPASDKDSNGKEIGERYCSDNGETGCTLLQSTNGGHDAQGNYYSWTAATAGTGTKSITSGDAPSSICPKGWKLPTGGNNDTTKKSFGGLTTVYGIDKSSTLMAAPLYFIYSGYVRNVGSYGYFWSSTLANNLSAHLLYFTSSSWYPSHSAYRYNGCPVRCVAAGTSAGSTTPSDPGSGINDPTLSVTIPNIITLDVYSDPNDKKNNVVNIDANTNDINTGEFIAEVSANTSYKITLNSTSEDPDTTSLIGRKEDGTLNDYSIPTLTTNTDASGNTTYIQPQKGISSWGIRTCTSMFLSSCDTEQYKPLPERNQVPDAINPFYTGTPGSNQSTLFQIGIGISPNLPSGTYSTQIQVTASPN